MFIDTGKQWINLDNVISVQNNEEEDYVVVSYTSGTIVTLIEAEGRWFMHGLRRYQSGLLKPDASMRPLMEEIRDFKKEWRKLTNSPSRDTEKRLADAVEILAQVAAAQAEQELPKHKVRKLHDKMKARSEALRKSRWVVACTD